MFIMSLIDVISFSHFRSIKLFTGAAMSFLWSDALPETTIDSDGNWTHVGTPCD